MTPEVQRLCRELVQGIADSWACAPKKHDPGQCVVCQARAIVKKARWERKKK